MQLFIGFFPVFGKADGRAREGVGPKRVEFFVGRAGDLQTLVMGVHVFGELCEGILPEKANGKTRGVRREPQNVKVCIGAEVHVL